GGADAAGAAYRTALRTQPGGYTAIAYADFLIAQGRPREARVVLHGQPDSDAVLLRIAIADPAGDAGRAAADELRRRFAQADLRPGAGAGHARERALFSLHITRDAEAALRHARENVKTQREPLDLFVLLLSAQAAGDAAALAWARQLIQETGLEDRRIEALL
ncbi:MAG TPA: hypothetical protein VMN83_16610, partial [Albitalea sp.]|nr:hypothetical protein [Albitalea sp.]